jgi:hypothetical protein
MTTEIKVWQPVDGETLIGQIVGNRLASGIFGENLKCELRADT